MVIWHEVTPLSRMLALVLFVAIIPSLFFFLGMTYQDAITSQQSIRVYDFPVLQHYASGSLPDAPVGIRGDDTIASSSTSYTEEHL